MTDQDQDTRDIAILQDFDAGIDAASLVDKYGVTVDYIQALILEAYKDDT